MQQQNDWKKITFRLWKTPPCCPWCSEATLSLNPLECSLVSLPLQQSGTGRSPPGSQSCSGSGGTEVPGPSWIQQGWECLGRGSGAAPSLCRAQLFASPRAALGRFRSRCSCAVDSWLCLPWQPLGSGLASSSSGKGLKAPLGIFWDFCFVWDRVCPAEGLAAQGEPGEGQECSEGERNIQ